MKQSAGLLMYRFVPDGSDRDLEVLLGHPGGPYFRNKDQGGWTVPKGLLEADESELVAARREFAEETGLGPECLPSSEDDFLDLATVRFSGGKQVHAWAFRGDCDPDALESNQFEIEWPPRSGRRESFPEIDRFAFFDLVTAADRIAPAQRPFLARLAEALIAPSQPKGD